MPTSSRKIPSCRDERNDPPKRRFLFGGSCFAKKHPNNFTLDGQPAFCIRFNNTQDATKSCIFCINKANRQRNAMKGHILKAEYILRENR